MQKTSTLQSSPPAIETALWRAHGHLTRCKQTLADPGAGIPEAVEQLAAALDDLAAAVRAYKTQPWIQGPPACRFPAPPVALLSRLSAAIEACYLLSPHEKVFIRGGNVLLAMGSGAWIGDHVPERLEAIRDGLARVVEL